MESVGSVWSPRRGPCAARPALDLPCRIDPITITLDGLRRYDQLDEFSRGFRERGREIHLDLRPLSTEVNDDHRRVDARVASVVSSVLLTSGGRGPLTVWLPDHDGLNAGIARGGLLFAMAQRDGPTRLFVGDVSRQDLLEDWKPNWNPNRAEFRQALSATGPGSPTGVGPIQADFLMLNNPHQSVPRERLAIEVSDNVAVPWVERVTRYAAPRATGAWVRNFSEAAGTVIRELLYNLSTHPFAPIARLPDLPKTGRKAYVELYSTRGGVNRVHLVVADTGHGISRTLRPKLRQLRSELTGATSEALVRRLLEQTLPTYGHAEGFGYGRIIELAQRFGGSVDVLTIADDEMGGTIRARWSEGKVSTERLPTLECRGTVVHATLTIESADEKQDNQPELFACANQG
ncbi:hypothetical protein HC251_14120 [Iamia sp. SCSIO 61187]|uniref:hypothetical protein n=1 Tax=Iamia sp. SCSIO 61187 TaxID=2722752 RepID=UPI001C63B275|nr:hypothetical protein [Iamia sp. SCSIO 61187]QYG93445.1 hypothetical protein HC251_14120 [Iamia sp. SCSIO 61187]